MAANSASNSVPSETRDDATSARERADPDACIILNAGSGKDREARTALKQAVERRSGRFDLRTVERGEDITEVAERAVKDGYAILVAAGGDGTIGAVAEIARAHDRTLGIVPMGTFNFFARGLSIPNDPDEALNLIAAGQASSIDLAEVNGRVFLNNASLGLYPAILAKREGIYRRWGRSRLAAHYSVIVTFLRFYQPVALEVAVNGKTIAARTPLAFVARSAHQLELFGLRGADDVRAGRLALFLMPDGSRRRLLALALRLALHDLREGTDYTYASGEHIEIETASSTRLIARDGERERMGAPFELRVIKRALRVIVPAAT